MRRNLFETFQHLWILDGMFPLVGNLDRALHLKTGDGAFNNGMRIFFSLRGLINFRILILKEQLKQNLSYF